METKVTSKNLILFQDDNILIANKPSGIPIHSTMDPNRKNFTDELQKSLNLEYIRTANRLDLETSGVVVFCIRPDYNKTLDLALKKSEKYYLLIVKGIVLEKNFRIESYLKEGKGKVKTVFAGGDKAITEFELLDTNPSKKISVLKAKLITGRRHQIRIHIAEKGYPILGEKVYSKSDNSIRCMLHSYQLILPIDEASPISVTAEIPEEFRNFFPVARLL